MKKIMNFLDRAEAMLEEAFMIFVFFAMLVAVLTGCDCSTCDRNTGTLMLRDGNGSYSAVCHGYYYAVASNPRFQCDDGRIILRPTNFMVNK